MGLQHVALVRAAMLEHDGLYVAGRSCSRAESLYPSGKADNDLALTVEMRAPIQGTSLRTLEDGHVQAASLLEKESSCRQCVADLAAIDTHVVLKLSDLCCGQANALWCGVTHASGEHSDLELPSWLSTCNRTAICNVCLRCSVAYARELLPRECFSHDNSSHASLKLQPVGNHGFATC